MKLLIYSHSFAPNVGGIETIVLSLAKGLAEVRAEGGGREFEITLVTETEAGRFEDATLPFPIVRRPGMFDLRKLIRAADVIHLAGPALAPLFWAWICKKPVAIEHHGYQAVCPNGLLLRQPDDDICPGHFLAREYGRCARCLKRETSALKTWPRLLLMFPRYFLTKRAAANIAISNHFVARCALPQPVMIYHGIEEPAAARAARSESQKKIRFAYVGRLVHEKGLPVLVEAASLLVKEGQPLELEVIGDGPESSALQSPVIRRDLRDHVRITGFLTGAAFADAVGKIDAVVMPSIWEETAGLAAMEQMMRGKLVIASAIGGLGEVVGDAGLKFEAGDARGLADAMRAVLQDPSLVDSLGQKARERAENLFRRERMIEEHAQVYRRLLSNKR
jgi:glycosyltransferase involved in cell wall biosynthesis